MRHVNQLAIKLFSFLVLLASSFSSGGIRTCEELAARIARRPYDLELSHTRLEWPKSITQNSAQLAVKVEQELLPLYKSAKHSWFQTKDGTRLNYSFFEAAPSARIDSQPKATLVISHGLGESRPQWLDQIKTFIEEGYNVFMYEHRGQAHSDRPLSNYHKVHVNRFEDYEDDMHQFVNEVVKPNAEGPVYGIGFSLGGLVSTFNTIHHPDDFSALVAISPAYQIRTRQFPVPLVKGLVDFMVLMGQSKEYSFFQKDFSEDKLDFLRRHTHDSDRWRSFLKVLDLYPMTVPGGLTHGWLSEILDANKRIQKEIKNLSKPTLVIEAGQDGLLFANVTERLVTKHPWISHYADENAFHSIIHDSDSIRNPAMTEIIRYLIHPQRLDSSKDAPDWNFLVAQSTNFSQRGELALSRYAVEEAFRRWKVENPTASIPKELSRQLRQSYELLEQSTPGQKGLYDFLRYYRHLENQKLYKN